MTPRVRAQFAVGPSKCLIFKYYTRGRSHNAVILGNDLYKTSDGLKTNHPTVKIIIYKCYRDQTAASFGRPKTDRLM